MTAEVWTHTSRGAVWAQGELLYGREQDGNYHALICLEAREVGPRGGIHRPAVYAEITSDRLSGVRQAIRRLGFHVARGQVAEVGR